VKRTLRIAVVDVALGRRIPSLAVGHFEESGRQPLASDLDPGQPRLDSGYVLIGKAHIGRAEVFLRAVQAARAEDWHDAWPFCEEPGERQRKYYAVNRDLELERQHRFHVANRERILERKRARRIG
jgi:hypothetical protein